jgi:hypothetical protein
MMAGPAAEDSMHMDKTALTLSSRQRRRNRWVEKSAETGASNHTSKPGQQLCGNT